MDRTKLAIGILSGAGLLVASCAATPPPAPRAQPEAFLAAPVARMPAPPPDEWNIFPDPTTGQVDVYHEGDYVGAITGKEPGSDDPPMPHTVAPAP